MRGELALHVMAPKAREHQIENNQIGGRLVDLLERVDAVFDGNHGVAGNREGRAIHLAERVIVFHSATPLPLVRAGARDDDRDWLCPASRGASHLQGSNADPPMRLPKSVKHLTKWSEDHRMAARAAQEYRCVTRELREALDRS